MTGRLGFSSESTGDIKENSFSIAPTFGFFVSNNIAIGAFVSYGSTVNEAPDEDDLETSSIGFGMFGRYYVTPASDFSFVAELGGGYVMAKQEQGVLEGKANGFLIAFTPGINYFISDHFALEASIGELSFSSVKPDNDLPGEESTDTFNLNLDFTDIMIGLVYKF
jgi:outer membrane protein